MSIKKDFWRTDSNTAQVKEAGRLPLLHFGDVSLWDPVPQPAYLHFLFAAWAFLHSPVTSPFPLWLSNGQASAKLLISAILICFTLASTSCCIRCWIPARAGFAPVPFYVLISIAFIISVHPDLDEKKIHTKVYLKSWLPLWTNQGRNRVICNFKCHCRPHYTFMQLRLIVNREG